MTKTSTIRFCDLLLLSIEQRMPLIKDDQIRADMEEQYLQCCTRLTNIEDGPARGLAVLTANLEQMDIKLTRTLMMGGID